MAARQVDADGSAPAGTPAAVGTPLPSSIGRPATNALTLAGYWSLESLDGASATDLLRLHGVGPTAVARLREALRARGRALRE